MNINPTTYKADLVYESAYRALRVLKKSAPPSIVEEFKQSLENKGILLDCVVLEYLREFDHPYNALLELNTLYHPYMEKPVRDYWKGLLVNVVNEFTNKGYNLSMHGVNALSYIEGVDLQGMRSRWTAYDFKLLLQGMGYMSRHEVYMDYSTTSGSGHYSNLNGMLLTYVCNEGSFLGSHFYISSFDYYSVTRGRLAIGPQFEDVELEVMIFDEYFDKEYPNETNRVVITVGNISEERLRDLIVSIFNDMVVKLGGKFDTKFIVEVAGDE